jgi:hypothetical protein
MTLPQRIQRFNFLATEGTEVTEDKKTNSHEGLEVNE